MKIEGTFSGEGVESRSKKQTEEKGGNSERSKINARGEMKRLNFIQARELEKAKLEYRYRTGFQSVKKKQKQV